MGVGLGERACLVGFPHLQAPPMENLFLLSVILNVVKCLHPGGSWGPHDSLNLKTIRAYMKPLPFPHSGGEARYGAREVARAEHS